MIQTKIHSLNNQKFLKTSSKLAVFIFLLISVVSILPDLDNKSSQFVDTSKKSNPIDPFAATAQDTYALTKIILGEFGFGRLEDIYVKDGLAYLADYYSGFRIVNISNLHELSEISHLYTVGNPYKIFVENDLAILSCKNAGIKFVNISDPRNPSLLGTYDIVCTVVKFAIQNQSLFIATDNIGIHILNITNFNSIQKIGEYRDINDSINDLSITKDFAYVLYADTEFVVLNISDPSHISRIGNYNDELLYPVHMVVREDIAFITDHCYGLCVLNLSDPRNPTKMSDFSLISWEWANHFAIEGDFAIVAYDDPTRIRLFNISNPHSPALLQEWDYCSIYNEMLFQNNFIYVPNGYDGLDIYHFGVDQDEDWLTDDSEQNYYHTNATNPDTEGDGMPDGWELLHQLNPLKNDANLDLDVDGLSNFEEYLRDLDPCEEDSDGDALIDGEEVNIFATNPNLFDTDGDGLNDGEEILNYGTDPRDQDTDNDLLSDYEEIVDYSTDPLLSDSDEDGLSDYIEVTMYYTDPLSTDTDGDGYSDYQEIREHDTDPNDFESNPRTSQRGSPASITLNIVFGVIFIFGALIFLIYRNAQ